MEARSVLLLMLLVNFSLSLTPTAEDITSQSQSAETTLGPTLGTPAQTTIGTLQTSLEPSSETSATSTLQSTWGNQGESTSEPITKVTLEIKVNPDTFKGVRERNVISTTPFSTDSSSATVEPLSTPSPTGIVSDVPFTSILPAAALTTEPPVSARGPTTDVPTTLLSSAPPPSKRVPTPSNTPTAPLSGPSSGPSSGPPSGPPTESPSGPPSGPPSDPWKVSPGQAVSRQTPPEGSSDDTTLALRTTFRTSSSTSQRTTPIPLSNKRSGGINLAILLAVVVSITALLVILIALWQRRRQRRSGAMTFSRGGGKRNGMTEAWAGPAQVPEDGTSGNGAPREAEEPRGGGRPEGEEPTPRSPLTTFFGKRKSAQGSALMRDEEAGPRPSCDRPSVSRDEAIPLMSYKEVTGEGENRGSPAGEPEPAPFAGADE